MIPSAPDDVTLHFSEMDVPSVLANPNLSPIREAREVWTLHVYGEKADSHPTPFKLVRVEVSQGGSTPFYAQYLQRDELLGKLELLKERNIRPVLLPSKTSLTQDFLFAAGAIARAWDNTRSNAIVKPVNSAEEYER
jgi:hypothetical protein